MSNAGKYCITLSNAHARQSHVKQVCKSLGWSDMEFILVEPDRRGGCIGSALSHMSAWSLSLSRGEDYCMVFEDDFKPSWGYSDSIMQEVTTFMERDAEWDVIQLGFGPRAVAHEKYDSLSLFTGATATTCKYLRRHKGLLIHAYCISRKAMIKMLEMTRREYTSREKCMLIDLFMVLKTPEWNWYSVVPMIFEQEWCFASANPYAGDFIDTYGRQYYCASRVHWFYLWSWLAYHRIGIIFLICLIILLVCLLRSNSNSKIRVYF
jgi:GR25 family glycosyltransferase involved in LPS biosynthesis